MDTSNITKTELAPISTNDPRLEYVLEQSKKATDIFVDAIRKSKEEHLEVSFKAFTLSCPKEEAEPIFEVIMTAIAIELKQSASDLLEIYTFYNSQEENPDGDEHCLFLHCRKEKVESKELVEVQDIDNKDEIVLPHASAMSAYKRPGGE